MTANLAASNWTGNVPSTAFELFGRPVAWYGIIVTASMLLGLLLGVVRGKKAKLNSDDLLEVFLFAIPFAIVFARAGYVLFRPDEFYVLNNFGWSDFWRLFAVWEGGLTVTTGVPGGILGALVWAKWRKVDFITVVDTILPVVLACQALGRWGNFFNQEIYGAAITDPNLQFFPLAVYIKAKGGFFMATFFYESFLNLAAFAVLWIVLNRFKLKGGGTLLYIISYAFIRFCMEFIRDDGDIYDKVNFLQIILAVVIVGAAALLIYLVMRQKKQGNRVWYKDGIPDAEWPAAKKAKPALEAVSADGTGTTAGKPAAGIPGSAKKPPLFNKSKKKKGK